jgi:hypothetical protein
MEPTCWSQSAAENLTTGIQRGQYHTACDESASLLTRGLKRAAVRAGRTRDPPAGYCALPDSQLARSG